MSSVAKWNKLALEKLYEFSPTSQKLSIWVSNNKVSKSWAL